MYEYGAYQFCNSGFVSIDGTSVRIGKWKQIFFQVSIYPSEKGV
jgi:riboflavin synthase alpha subunit